MEINEIIAERYTYRGISISDNKSWIYGTLNVLNILGGKLERKFMIEYSVLGNYQSGTPKTEVIRETIGQYLCKTDRYGTRVFEGDIVKYLNKVYEIVYSGKHLKFVMKDSRGTTIDFSEVDWIDVEVIGNMHDTPELMKKNRSRRNENGI